MILRTAILLATLASALFAQRQGKNPQGWSFDRFPTYRHGTLEFNIKARVQADVRGFSPAYEPEDGNFDFRRARISFDGQWRRNYEYEFDLAASEQKLIRDLYVNLRHIRNAQLKIGKFKIPFGLDQLTPPARLDFATRSRLADQIAPARDTGIMLHGRFFRRGLGYEGGFFYGDGDNAETSDNKDTGKNTFAGRIVAAALRPLPVPKPLKTIELGVAATSSATREILGGIRGRNAARETIFPRVNVRGRRVRFGTELNWLTGPFSVKGEYAHARDQRLRQSLSQNDLPDAISRGWYLSGTWLLTGEKKEDRIDPRRPLFQRGLGAIELAARYEAIRFASDTSSGVPSRSPRASNIYRQSDRAWTFGTNWTPNKWSRTQFNAVHETLEDPQRTPVSGMTRFWTFIARFQFTL